VQLNVSPTYADPKAGGSWRTGASIKVPVSFPFSEGYARDAAGLISASAFVDCGRGFWSESEGFESLFPRGSFSQRALSQ